MNRFPKKQETVDKCVYCENNIGNVFIKCDECYEYYTCLKCFSMSAELGTHKKDHKYRICFNNSNNNSLTYPIFNNESIWTHEEETQLLASIEQFGFGNWEDISEKNLKNKKADECMQHYYAYYVYGNIGKYTLKTTHNSLDTYNIDHTKESDNLTILLPPIEMSIEEQRALGYMPLRDDFEREYKNDSEYLLSNLATCNDDDETDIEMKIALIKMYRECLFERQRLKSIARQYGLINNTSALINKQQQQTQIQTEETPRPGRKKRLILDDKSTINGTSIVSNSVLNSNNEKYKKFAQFLTVSTYENLMENMRKKPLILNRIQELMKYRELGIKKLDDIEKYKQDKQKREDDKKKFRLKIPSSPLNSKLKTTLDLNDFSLLDNSNSNESSLTTISSENSLENANIVKNSVSSSKRKSLLFSGTSTSSSSSSTLSSPSGRIERICSMSGYNLLSENEKKLITSLNLKPNLYITFKTFCIKNSLKNSSSLSQQNQTKSNAGPIRNNRNTLTNNKLMSLCPNNYFQIPRSTKKSIIRFLSDNGWIDIQKN